MLGKIKIWVLVFTLIFGKNDPIPTKMFFFSNAMVVVHWSINYPKLWNKTMEDLLEYQLPVHHSHWMLCWLVGWLVCWLALLVLVDFTGITMKFKLKKHS